jgi:hypothetical protein
MEPLYILMEFAMHGSLKDYLKSVKTGEMPNPQLLLYQQQQQLHVGQAPPIATPSITVTTNPPVANGSTLGQGASASGMTSSVYPATNRKSMLSLCPYHYNQLTQHNHNGPPPYMSSSAPTGGTPSDQHYHHLYPAGAQAAEESVSLGTVDPASKAHAMRLLRLLNSEYGLQQLTDDHECCHDDTQGSEAAAIKLGQSAYSYSGLSEMCVRRACLDDYPYWYHGTMPRNDYYNSYYNYSEPQEQKEESESPFADTPGTNAPLLPPPPIYINACEGEGDANSSGDPQQECHCHRLSATNLNPYHSYNLSTASGGCVYCCQCAAAVGEAVGGGGGGGVGVYQQTRADQPSPGGGGANVTADNTETRLSYFEVLDFALQIARGMEHLEKMKVSFGFRQLFLVTCTAMYVCTGVHDQ